MLVSGRRILGVFEASIKHHPPQHHVRTKVSCYRLKAGLHRYLQSKSSLSILWTLAVSRGFSRVEIYVSLSSKQEALLYRLYVSDYVGVNRQHMIGSDLRLCLLVLVHSGIRQVNTLRVRCQINFHIYVNETVNCAASFLNFKYA